ncbi:MULTISPECIES: DUF3077 domain-containing protein [Pseudomonas]|uniref:DUF3077 domain-containing protein n=1 Tax=Pseudomonas TaxID=286 RepID=UPI000C887A65|nr:MULTISPECIES: DUF3077 domain-containing protein [Pseudomonas]AZC51949.1 hypothetical protein C4K35_4374 [Pseudomonas chlororaphis subsp. piscium]AZC58389.1 hypothetical protein C4K34_4232 [Pseudomonas chlororaphis subsp. piscium]AZC77081.1 hypothetical protein C4K31_4186 [Pseudomonas chlororaphis subsp. piscium]AZC83295.1 hypothetical protein C4K30_4189 [Pseudomonas chlororaphis subsp. piscium]AZC90632.1 hypothetical protein C4K29_4339 [Pseudomonas chlororaphis subsp. piscium]
MSTPTPIKTLGFVTFGACADLEQTLFRVNADVPLQQALEHASTLLYYAKKLALDAAMEEQGERYAWASHFLAEMGKAVIDDVCLGLKGGEGR